MLKAIRVVVVLAAAGFAQSAANDEAQIWSLEKAYLEYAGRCSQSFRSRTL